MALRCIANIILLTATLSLIGLYVHQLPYLPLETDYSKTLPELSSTEPLELLDPKTGLLKHEGWSTYPNKWLYNPGMNKAYVPVFSRQKHWNYYYIISDDYLVTMAHTDLGLIKNSYINVRNIKDMGAPMIQTKVVDFFGTSVSIDTEKNGPGVFSTIHHPSLNMTFFRRPEESFSKIDVRGKTAQGIVEGNFTADSKGYEGLAHVSAKPGDPTKHSFKYKLHHKFTGELFLEGRSIIKCTKESPCLGLHDNSRGFHPYAGRWIWVSTCFISEGHEVSINIGYSHDNPNSSFDTVFVDGKLYKIDPMVLYEVKEDHWKWEKVPESNKHKNKFKLEFFREHQHSLGANYLLYDVDLNSNFGYFSGSIETDDGKTVKFDKVFGFIENFHARW